MKFFPLLQFQMKFFPPQFYGRLCDEISSSLCLGDILSFCESGPSSIVLNKYLKMNANRNIVVQLREWNTKLLLQCYVES